MSSFVTNAKNNIFSSPKVTSSHQSKLSETENELKELEEKISRYSVVIRPAKKDDCVLPEDERTEVAISHLNSSHPIPQNILILQIEAELECPVCLEICRPPIYQCGEGGLRY